MSNSWRPDDTQSQPTHLMVDMMATQDDTVNHLLSSTGPIAAASPNWEDRPQQRQLAQVVRRALKQRASALIEGGCGTGKTAAYALPLIMHAKENKQQVLISTHTTALQDQLGTKDLPFLQRALAGILDFTFAVVKGRGQSLCEAKYSHSTAAPEIEAWYETTTDGDLGALVLTPQQRGALTATSEECPGSKCSFAEVCWWLHARQRARQADVVVVSHALLVAGLQAEPGTVLPSVDAIVVDEAHELADVIRESLGIRVSPKGVQQVVKQAEKFAGTVAEGIPHELSRLLATLQHAHRAKAEEGTALLDPDRDLAAGGTAENHLVELTEQLDKLAREVQAVGDDYPEEAEEWATSRKLMDALERLAANLRSLRIGRSGRVSWLELADGASLNAQPVDVSSWLRERTRVPIVLSSATLATGPQDFTYISETLGVRSSHMKQVGSPFDWGSQAWIYLPTEGLHDGLLGTNVRGAKERAELSREYARVTTLHAREFFRWTKGRGMWLFTSRADMELVRDLARQDFPCPFITQGEMGLAESLKWLRESGGVLFGLASLWTGVDLQGSALSALAIHKIPFPPPSDLIHEARLKAAGGGRYAFQQLSVPYAVTKLKQGFGRLIRTGTDRGVAALFDPRLRGKHAAILDALPPARRITRADLRHVPWHLAAAGEPVPGDPQVAEALRRLAASGTVQGAHRVYLARMVDLLGESGTLPRGLWTAGAWLCDKYQNVSERT